MTSKSAPIEYRCDEDCLQGGCPGHTVVAAYRHTSDMLSFCFGRAGESPSLEANGHMITMDEAKWKAMQSAYGTIRW